METVATGRTTHIERNLPGRLILKEHGAQQPGRLAVGTPGKGHVSDTQRVDQCTAVIREHVLCLVLMQKAKLALVKGLSLGEAKFPVLQFLARPARGSDRAHDELRRMHLECGHTGPPGPGVVVIASFAGALKRATPRPAEK